MSDLRAGDAETHTVEGERVGGPVDPAPVKTTFADVVTDDRERRPVIPAGLRSGDQRRQLAAETVRLAGYRLAFHTVRTPKYLLFASLWAPVGLVRLSWAAWRWAYDLEGWSARQHAVTRNAVDDYMALMKTADRHRRGRVPILFALLAVALVAVGLVWWLAPLWAQVVLGVGAVAVLARHGRPADRPILDRTVDGPRFTRLTAEMVRTALCSIGLSGIKDPGSVTFPAPGIHRDGPGWLARVNLPAGVEAVDVLERRGRISSALRLPVDQVWPTAGPDHAGQLDLWVGYKPASKMGQPPWSLAAENARTSVFEPVEFGTDQRQRPVRTIMFARNFLIGGVPGSGKSYGARTLAIAAALDPTCELKIAEFKGTADFGDLAPLCSTYVCGVDDIALQQGADIIAWGLAEAERRGKRIRAARERGEAPEGKVTPELAARPGSGLHPVLILIDEAHELLVEKEVAANAERLIKRGRALGLIVVLATQVPDAKSVPPNITRCVTVRWCMAVQDQVANDMILGTGSYKRGLTATVYRPGLDAGWGVITGLAEPTAVRSHYPTPEVGAQIVARATTLRGGQPVAGDTDVPARDPLGDVLRVFAHAGRTGLHWEKLAELLAEQQPDAYEGISAEAVSAMVRSAGVPGEQVKVDGVNRQGCKRREIEAAIERREIESR